MIGLAQVLVLSLPFLPSQLLLLLCLSLLRPLLLSRFTAERDGGLTLYLLLLFAVFCYVTAVSAGRPQSTVLLLALSPPLPPPHLASSPVLFSVDP